MASEKTSALFAEVVLPHLDHAYALARWLTGNPADAEDVVQDACVRALKGLPLYAGGSARAWVLTIVRNTAFTWLARNRPKAIVLTDDVEAAERSRDGLSRTGECELTPEAALIAKAEAAEIEAAIACLPPPYQETIVLRDINGLGYREIAEVTKVPIGTVMSRLARGRSLLIAKLGRDQTGEGAIMNDRSRDDWRLLMQASIDGELDAAAALDLERCLAEDRNLAAEYERLAALKDVVARHFPLERAPDSLRARITALTDIESAEAPPRKARYEWRAMAASALVAAGLASGATWFAATNRNQALILDQALIADHRRGLLAASPVDVVSTDRHTVKPWFDEHLAQSPAVVDLADKGFTLVGGRVDIVAGQPAPTLVYRLREHLISLTALRANVGVAAAPASIGGYSVIAWQEGDFTYWAVSDVEQADLEFFVAAFRAAAQG